MGGAPEDYALNWVVHGASPRESETFASAKACHQLDGIVISDYGLNELRKVEACGQCYFIKKYHSRGRGLRRFLGRSRARAEWENILLFQCLGIPTPRLVAYGEYGQNGVVVTAALPDVCDLQTYAQRELSSRFVESVIDRLSRYVRTLHSHGFVHNDLKWRNILAKPDGEQVYIIDSPLGRHVPRLLIARRIVKDLACLDKVAKYRLTRTQRFRFYLRYKDMDRLRSEDKKEITRIQQFFKDRE